jgi:glucose-1-phosphate thymidylyltransferase
VPFDHSEIIGLIPAAGWGKRLFALPCSKELFPLGLKRDSETGNIYPKVAIQCLLEKMRCGGITKSYIIIREGKWDIPAYLNDGRQTGVDIAYLLINLSPGVPFTLDQAFPFVKNDIIVFGFPDIIFHRANAFSQLIDRRNETNADVVLGLFPAYQPSKMDMVNVDEDGRVRSIEIKPRKTQLHYSWIIATWTPVFTKFMHDFVELHKQKTSCQDVEVLQNHPEIFLGHVFGEAINTGIHVDSVCFDREEFLDIGTPDDLVQACLLNTAM